MNGVFTGTPGNDVLVVTSEFTLLAHNRFDLGDPGFESRLDFDSVEPGTQTRTTSAAQFSYVSGEGDDVLQLVGSLTGSLDALDMGTGTDRVDASQMNFSFELGATPAQRVETVDVVIGTNFADGIYGYADGAARATLFKVFGGSGNDMIQGSLGPDRLDGGGGSNEIYGYAGDDVIAVAAPISSVEKEVDGGAGNDLFVMTGSNAIDEIHVVGPKENFWAWDINNPAGGYNAQAFERARVNLLGGDDYAGIVSWIPAVAVTGGAGADEVVIDAFGGVANVEPVGAARRFTVPIAYGNVVLAPEVVTVDASVEHAYLLNETTIGTAPGPGGGPHVRTFRPDGTPAASFFAYHAAFSGGVNLAMGDLNGDLDDEIITAAGPGGGPHVRVFYSDGTDTGIGFFAYDPSFNGGVDLAAIDVNGDGLKEIVTVPASGMVPLVRIWSASGQLLAEWQAAGFGMSGLHVARGGIGFDYTDLIVVSSAAGTDGAVRVFYADGSIAQEYQPFAPFGSFQGGATVSRGMFKNSAGANQADRYDEIVVGAGPGGGPLVRVFERSKDWKQMNALGAFYAYGASFAGGVEVATCNADGGADEVVTAPGRGMAPVVRTFGIDGKVKRKSFLAYDINFTSGIHVVCGSTSTRAFHAAAYTQASVATGPADALGRFSAHRGQNVAKAGSRWAVGQSG